MILSALEAAESADSAAQGQMTWTGAAVLIVAIVIGLLLRRLKQRRGGRSGQGEAAANTSGDDWRKSVGVLRETTAAPLLDTQAASPGRYGLGATRDLDAAEIRALRPSYSPRIDGEPDPGEIVWTWVPYSENDGRGKDRPVLIIARIDEGSFAGCYLSTKPHRGFVSVGTGGWDSQRRESFLAPDRVLRVETGGMRREGQILARDRFEHAVDAVSRLHRING